MEPMNIPAPLLQAFYSALSIQESQRIHFPRVLWREIMDRGWAHLSGCDDLAIAMDRRLGRIGFSRLLPDLAAILSIPIRTIFGRPRYMTSGAIGFDGISAADCAALFIFLEQCGFNVDANPMVSDLRPLIAERSHLTPSEFEIFRYPSSQDRSELTLVATPRLESRESVIEKLVRTARGYRIKVMLYDDQPMRVTVRGPRWRKPRPREDVTCEICGMQYEKGDPESAHQHRSYHARIMRVLEPKPNKRMLERIATDRYPQMVTEDSPLWMHREMYQRAYLFKREFHYDFTQWRNPSKRADREPGAVGFLFTDEHGRIDGACAFRKDPDQWCLDFVWIRPAMRRQGLLAARWPQFVEMFGDFWLERPLSDAMKLFVTTHGTKLQQEKSL
jgi:hypothetical protein